MKGILGKKIGMTEVFTTDGKPTSLVINSKKIIPVFVKKSIDARKKPDVYLTEQSRLLMWNQKKLILYH